MVQDSSGEKAAKVAAASAAERTHVPDGAAAKKLKSGTASEATAEKKPAAEGTHVPDGAAAKKLKSGTASEATAEKKPAARRARTARAQRVQSLDELIRQALAEHLPEEQAERFTRGFGCSDTPLTAARAIALAQVSRALEGDVKAFELIRSVCSSGGGSGGGEGDSAPFVVDVRVADGP